MARMIDQIRESKLPSNMMQFAARGALQVASAENIEILVYIAKHNQIFGDVARLTLAGWEEKSSVAVASDPATPREVLDYLISPDNLRPALLPALLENPSVSEGQLVKLAVAASRESVQTMLRSKRVPSLQGVLDALRANPYLKKEEAEELKKLSAKQEPAVADKAPGSAVSTPASAGEAAAGDDEVAAVAAPEVEEAVTAYMKEHAEAIAAEGEKKFQSIGGGVELLASFETEAETAPAAPQSAVPAAKPVEAAMPKPAIPAKKPEVKRENTLQKINGLDVKGRIQLALKGNKEERSILIRDGTKVVALAVLEAPKLSDGEVEKFASQKNVLEAVLRQIPLKRRFMKNYIVVRNLVANPRTPLDLGLGLMKNLLAQDLKNISANKEVSETIRKLAMKMYKQKLEAAAKK